MYGLTFAAGRTSFGDRLQDVGMEEIDDGIWNIVYYNTILGRIDRKTGRITGQDKV